MCEYVILFAPLSPVSSPRHAARTLHLASRESFSALDAHAVHLCPRRLTQLVALHPIRTTGKRRVKGARLQRGGGVRSADLSVEQPFAVDTQTSKTKHRGGTSKLKARPGTRVLEVEESLKLRHNSLCHAAAACGVKVVRRPLLLQEHQEPPLAWGTESE